jgi:hypothetical protein
MVVPAIAKKTYGFVLLVVLWDAAGSNLAVWRGMGHGLAHFEASGPAISVKLGTITPEGDAGSYSLVLCSIIS